MKDLNRILIESSKNCIPVTGNDIIKIGMIIYDMKMKGYNHYNILKKYPTIGLRQGGRYYSDPISEVCKYGMIGKYSKDILKTNIKGKNLNKIYKSASECNKPCKPVKPVESVNKITIIVNGVEYTGTAREIAEISKYL